MKQIDPEPKENSQGGTDFVMCACDRVCYSLDVYGVCVESCPDLVISIFVGVQCRKNDR